MRRALLSLLPLFVGCSVTSGTLPSLTLSTQLADGLSCRDAGATSVTIPLPRLADGAMSELVFVCYLTETPRTVEATNLPTDHTLDVLAVSAEGATLYRGQLHASELVGATTPSATVVLFPDAAR